MKPLHLLFTCEHAVNDIPPEFGAYFLPHQDVLNTHRGIDFGALTIAQHLSKAFSLPLYAATISRLLIEHNRSLGHRSSFSEFSINLSQDEKERLIQTYYLPYRQSVQQYIQENIDAGFQVCHLSIHSFTPIWNGLPRNAEIGLLYNPKRPSEKALAKRWQKLLNPTARTRLNYPYHGDSDSFTTSLRKLFPDDEYIGIEVEVNQALAGDPEKLNDTMTLLETTLKILGG